jgi:hypothetical protein
MALSRGVGRTVRGAYLCQLHVDYVPISPGGAGGGQVLCVRHPAVQCGTRTVSGKDVMVIVDHRGAGAPSVSLEYVGPQYAVGLLAGQGIPGFDVAAAVRFVCPDRRQPRWSWRGEGFGAAAW